MAENAHHVMESIAVFDHLRVADDDGRRGHTGRVHRVPRTELAGSNPPRTPTRTGRYP